MGQAPTTKAACLPRGAVGSSGAVERHPRPRDPAELRLASVLASRGVTVVPDSTRTRVVVVVVGRLSRRDHEPLFVIAMAEGGLQSSSAVVVWDLQVFGRRPRAVMLPHPGAGDQASRFDASWVGAEPRRTPSCGGSRRGGTCFGQRV